MLRKPTEMFRATLVAMPRVIVGPEIEVDAEGDPVQVDATLVRRVTLLLHEENQVYLAIDCDPASIDARDAYWVEPTLGHPIPFELLAGQTLVGRASAELHELGVIVEYIRG